MIKLDCDFYSVYLQYVGILGNFVNIIYLAANTKFGKWTAKIIIWMVGESCTSC